jgi:hypothetical protein
MQFSGMAQWSPLELLVDCRFLVAIKKSNTFWLSSLYHDSQKVFDFN